MPKRVPIGPEMSEASQDAAGLDDPGGETTIDQPVIPTVEAPALAIDTPPDKPKRPARTRKPAAAVPVETPDSAEEAVRAQEEPVDGIQFHELDDAADFVSVVYYGTEGTRKTTNACLMTRLPGPGRVLVVNAEAGLKKQALRQHGVDTSRIVVWPAPGQQVSFTGLQKLFFRLQADLDADPASWLGVIWDSATDIHQTLLDQVVEAEIAQQREILARSGGKSRAGNITLRDEFDTDRDDYKKMSNQFRQLLRKFRYLPCHFAVTALLRKDEEGRKVVYGPAVTPAIQTDLMGYVDMVLRTQVAKIGTGHVGFAQTVPDDTHRAKDRYDVLPDELPNPSFDRLVRYVTGGLDAATDPDAGLLDPNVAKRATPAQPQLSAQAQTIQDNVQAIQEANTPAGTPEADEKVRALAGASKSRPARNAARRTSGKLAPAAPATTDGDKPPF